MGHQLCQQGRRPRLKQAGRTQGGQLGWLAHKQSSRSKPQTAASSWAYSLRAAATCRRPAGRTSAFQCSVTALAMSSLLLVGCTPCTSYCLVYFRSVWTCKIQMPCSWGR